MKARKSANRKFIVCGACGRKLCRRDRVERAEVVHVLVWGDGWHVVDDHIEMRDTALDRLLAGHKPGRKDWMNEARLGLTRALRAYAPAVCPYCGTLNVIDPKPLDVDGIASY